MVPLTTRQVELAALGFQLGNRALVLGPGRHTLLVGPIQVLGRRRQGLEGRVLLCPQGIALAESLAAFPGRPIPLLECRRQGLEGRVLLCPQSIALLEHLLAFLDRPIVPVDDFSASLAERLFLVPQGIALA
ncbi:MAG: hypothetical protein GY711_23925 [bacterium]|nr:hypothetical protein [bacterium]